MKLLIVDDNIEIRKILKSICREYFDETIECSDGDEAIELFESYMPDLTIMDIKMKRLDGLEATRIIKKKFPDAKIIVVSQYKDNVFMDAAINVGAIKYLNKEDLIKIDEIIKENYNL